MDKDVLSVGEVAEFLGVSTSTIYTMIKNNEIPYLKLRGRYLFYKEPLMKWMWALTKEGKVESRDTEMIAKDSY